MLSVRLTPSPPFSELCPWLCRNSPSWKVLLGWVVVAGFAQRIGVVVPQRRLNRGGQEGIVLVEGGGLSGARGQLLRKMPAIVVGLGGRTLHIEGGGVIHVVTETAESGRLPGSGQRRGIGRIGAVTAGILVRRAGGRAGEERAQHAIADEVHHVRERTGGHAALDQAARRRIRPAAVQDGGEGIGRRAVARLQGGQRAIRPGEHVERI